LFSVPEGYPLGAQSEEGDWRSGAGSWSGSFWQRSCEETRLMDEGSNRETSTPDLAQSAPTTEPATGRPSPDAEEPLVPPERLGELRRRWETTQTRFVDEPRRSVEEADQLVGEVLRILADTYASERSALEQQWGSGEEASTEALRLILQRYRAFFNRLLTA